MTPYGAAGFGPNPYDPWGSSFYGGYSPTHLDFMTWYNPFGSPMGNMGWGYNAWGVNPYMGNSWGYNPYGYGYGGYNPYIYAGTGFEGTGLLRGMNNGWGTGWYDVNNVVVAPRTPIWTSSAINSNGTGGRLLTNKVDVDTESGSTPLQVPERFGGGLIQVIQERHAPRRRRHRLRIRPGIRGQFGAIPRKPSNQTRSTTSSSRTNSTRNTNWSGSSSSSSSEALEARRNRALLPTAVHPEVALAGAPAEVEEAQGEAAVNLPLSHVLARRCPGLGLACCSLLNPLGPKRNGCSSLRLD